MSERIIDLRDAVPGKRYKHIHLTPEEKADLGELCYERGYSGGGVGKRSDWMTPDSLRYTSAGAARISLRDIAKEVTADFIEKTSITPPSKGDLAEHTLREFPLDEQKAFVAEQAGKAERLYNLSDRGLCAHQSVGDYTRFSITLLGARALGHLRIIYDDEVYTDEPEKGWDE